MASRLLGSALVIALALVPVHACGPKLPNVKITVVVILATENDGPIDKRLKHIAAEIQKLNPSLKSFELKNMTDKSVPPNEKVTFNLVDMKKALVVVKHGADDGNKVGLAVTAPDQGEIVYSTVCGKFLPIVTRYETKKGERLILAIRVQPCKGE
ncbi:MAG: hypothetical protein U0793_08775 [Gemmataceae bacterium]